LKVYPEWVNHYQPVKADLANFCIFEWEGRMGTGRVVMFYVGAVGVIGEAILMDYQEK
jgi:hypothetical protein